MKTVSMIAAIAALSACTSAIEVYRPDVSKEERRALFEADVKTAQASITDIDIKVCLDVFKSRMNDPKSFELARSPSFNRVSSEVWWVTFSPMLFHSGVSVFVNPYGGSTDEETI